MKAAWIMSLLVSIIFIGGGLFGVYYVHGEIPQQLKATSTIALATEKGEDKKAEDMPKELKDVVRDVQKVVVKIEVPTGVLGSGFLYNDKGDVITNAHVVTGAKDVKIKTTDAREFDGTVIGISTDTDVAVVRVPGLANSDFLKVSKTKAEVGDQVLALGSPLGLQNTVTDGIISGVDRDFDLDPYHYEDVYQISAPITHGNSGGPLVNEKTGEALGINSAGMDEGSIGFSIPLVNVISMIEGWSATPMANLPDLVASSDAGYDYDEGSYSEDAQYLVEYFYESIDAQDYVTAYSLLGSDWQTGTAYEDFRNGYLQTDYVTVDDISSTDDGDDSFTVIAIISATENVDSGTQYSKYRVTYHVGMENDQLKILSGEAKKL